MKPLFDISKLLTFKSNTKLPFKCYNCSNIFYIEQKHIKSAIKRNLNHHSYCSRNCARKHTTKLVKMPCGNCNKIITKVQCEILKSKSGKIFCSKRCAAIHNNINKIYGIRRSKIEIFIESKLKEKYKNLNIQFNIRSIIGLELDIYIPSLSLAFEINGIFHYKEIYGEDKYKNIITNDMIKASNCNKLGIHLNVINISSMKIFNIDEATIYLQNILKIINNNLIQKIFS